MSKQYKEMIEAFFEKYSERRREWVSLLSEWKEAGTHRVELKKVERLMAQVEESHTAAQALLAHNDVDESRVDRLLSQMKGCYSELHALTKPQWRQSAEELIKALIIIFVARTYVFGHYHVPTGSAEPNLLVGDHVYVNKSAYIFSKPTYGDLIVFNDMEFRYDKNPLQKWWQKYIGFGVLGLLKQGPMNVVKRVIGLPGDVIEGKLEGGRPVLYRNGERLEEPYRNPYPLIVLKREVGLFDRNSLLGSVTPRLLHKTYKEVRYCYDPSKSLEDQPFYEMHADEVVRNPFTKDPILLLPDEPSTEYRTGRTVDVFGPVVVPEGKYWAQGDSRRNSRDCRYWMFVDEEEIHGKLSMVLFSLDSEELVFLVDLLKRPLDFFTKVIRWDRFCIPLWNIPDIRLEKHADTEKEVSHE
jgi:signal peptidase I